MIRILVRKTWLKIRYGYWLTGWREKISEVCKNKTAYLWWFYFTHVGILRFANIFHGRIQTLNRTRIADKSQMFRPRVSVKYLTFHWTNHWICIWFSILKIIIHLQDFKRIFTHISVSLLEISLCRIRLKTSKSRNALRLIYSNASFRTRTPGNMPNRMND